MAGNPYVFAGRGAGPMTNFAQRKDELDAKLPAMPPWVIHDLRRSARSLLSRAGVRPDIAERVLGHAIRGARERADRLGRYIEYHRLCDVRHKAKQVVMPSAACHHTGVAGVSSAGSKPTTNQRGIYHE